MQANFTPGPWRVGNAGRGVFASIGSHLIADVDNKANARLIASAPELIEAINNLIAITNTPEFSKILEDANFLDDDSFHNLLLARDKAIGNL